MKKAAKIGIAAVVAAVAVGLASPLFYETEVNEALPAALDEMQTGLTLEEFETMDEGSRSVLVDSMPEDLKGMIMDASARKVRPVSENMDEDGPDVLKRGSFAGLAGHAADGDAKILDVSGTRFLRFENFEVTNGPDLRVYLAPDGSVSQGIELGKLKGSRGSQNYNIDGIDTDVYNTVVIYCQPFRVYFGEAQLFPS